MAFLVATLGPLEAWRWSDLVREHVACEQSNFSAWHDDDASVRLGSVGLSGAVRSTTRFGADLAVAVVGRTEGQADSSVAVLHEYLRAGLVGLARLNGDYAYALWDRREQAMLVGCDAVGLRAPAYTWTGQTFLLSTRAAALLGQIDGPAWDQLYLAHALSGLWSRGVTATAFERIHRMAGGEILRVSSNGLERLSGNRLRFARSGFASRRLALAQLGDLLDDVVGNQLHEGQSCIALSGGIDSCLVATALTKRRPELDAFSLVAPEGGPGADPALLAVVTAVPGLRHHKVLLPVDGVGSLASGDLSDDPVCGGPVLQPGRIALLRAIRDKGFQQVFDGEGGDELFDIAWRPGDLIRQMAIARVFAALGTSGSRSRLLHDFVVDGRRSAFSVFLERARRRVHARRPWLRAQFWGSSAFASAWEDAISFWRLRSASERLPEILGAHGRYWRTQELARLDVGVEGSSPFLHRQVIEFVGSVGAEVAIDLDHGKVLLRRLAANRVPAAIAWRPKSEPLSDWLIQRWLSVDTNVERTIRHIKSSPFLGQVVDIAVVAASVDQARQVTGPSWLASSIVELGALVDWMATIEQRFGL